MSAKLETVLLLPFFIEIIEEQHSLKADVHLKKWLFALSIFSHILQYPLYLAPFHSTPALAVSEKTSLRGLFFMEKSDDGGRSLKWFLDCGV